MLLTTPIKARRAAACSHKQSLYRHLVTMQAAVVVAVLLLGAAVCLADDPTVSLNGVVDLTPENFDQYVNGAKHCLVEFYAPWCGHCKHLVPEYKKLGETVSKDATLSSRVVIAKVDADKHRSLGERFGVQGFPTIKYFQRGKPVSQPESYEEGRTSERFLAFLAKKIQEDGSFARVDALDTFAEQYLSADDKETVVRGAEKAWLKLSGDDSDNGRVYIEVMRKALAKGDEYFQKEKARVERVLSAGGIHATKAEMLAKKASVLTAFVKEE